MTIKFRWKLIFLVLITLVLAGAAYVIVSLQLAENIKNDITERIVKSNDTYKVFNENSFEQLILQVKSISDNPKFAGQLSTGDRATVQQGLDEFNTINQLNATIFAALNPAGQVMAYLGSGMNANMNLAQRPEINSAIQGFDNGGFWEESGRLIRVGVSPIIIDKQVQGVLVMGFAIDDTTTRTIARVTNSNIAFLVGGTISAMSLADAKMENLSKADVFKELKQHQAMIDQAIIRKTQSEAFIFTVGGEQFMGVASPVFASPGTDDQEQKVIASYVFFKSLDKALAPLVESQRVMLLVGGGITVLAFMIALLIINGVNKPVRQLSEAMHAVQSGNLDFEVKVTTKDELGQLGMTFNEMTQGLKQKERVEGLFGKYLSPDVAKKVLAEQSVDGILKGEKANLSVMFTDIRGFTPMSRGMDPQELINLLNSHFDESIDIIDRYGGTLDKFIGDAILAFFGAPVHYDDFFMRAINAAVQMQRASEKFNFQRKLEGKEPINIGIGINSGDAVVGNIGSNKRLEYTVIGETVNIANRLCSVAKKGQIIISQSTYDLLPNKAIASPIEHVSLKGVTEAVTVYEVLWKG